MLVAVNDNSILDELIDYEILDSERKIAKKLQLLKMPRTNTSGSNAHYSIDENRLPKLNSGYLVQVKENIIVVYLRRVFCVSFVNIFNIVCEI